MNREIAAIIILFKDRQQPVEQKRALLTQPSVPSSPALAPRRLSWSEDSCDSDETLILESSPEKEEPAVNLSKALEAEKKRLRTEESKRVEVKARPLHEKKKPEAYIKKVHDHSLYKLIYQVSWFGTDPEGKPWPKSWNTVEDCCAQSNWAALRREYCVFRTGNPKKS